MQITKITNQARRGLIPVKSWGGVVHALTVFESGLTPGSQATQSSLVNAIAEDSGPMAAGLAIMGSTIAGKQSSLLGRLLFEAGQALEENSSFHKSYDYDAMGTSFFKSSVTIEKLGEDMFGIGLSAAYVGNEIEIGLAESLGLTRALHSCTIEVAVEPTGPNSFAFDFSHVREKLDGLLDFNPTGRFQLTGESLSKTFFVGEDYYTKRKWGGLHNDGDIFVRLESGNIADRHVWEAGEIERDTWSIDGSIFSGELARDYGSNDENAKAMPTFNIIVCKVHRHDTRAYKGDTGSIVKLDVPIWEPEVQQQVVDLAAEIEAALQA